MILEANQALSAGDELWIISSRNTSHWFERIDWLVNFKLSQLEIHKSKKLSPWIKDYLENCQLNDFNFNFQELNSSSHLIPVAQWLPTKWLFMISYSDSIQQWIENTHINWIKWQKPNMRVFLPNTIQLGEWKSYWKTLENQYNPTIILETKQL